MHRYAVVWMGLALLACLMAYTAYKTNHHGPVPCDTDANCHALNPGLCADDEPYCFEPEALATPADYRGHKLHDFSR